MKRYGNLFGEIVSFENLVVATKKAFRGKKDKTRVAQFYFDMENELLRIREELRNKTYRPQPLRIFWIREPKAREIGASDFRDRVVHHAVCNILEPILERGYVHHSYACRAGKGTHRAVRQAQIFSRKNRYYLRVKSYLRYMDDFILFGDEKVDLHSLHFSIRNFLHDELELELKEKATMLAPVREGIPFLGFRIFPKLIRLKQENKKRALNTLKSRTRAFKARKIGEEEYSRSLMSTTEHLKIANTYNFRKDVFNKMFF
jgi:hypothetical protein